MEFLRSVPAFVFVFGGLACLILAFSLWHIGRRRDRQDVFTILSTDPKQLAQRAATPVGLLKPIKSDADWRAIQVHARDAAYRRAVETVRNRYQLVGNPMLLPNTLRTTMDRWDISFRDAMIRVANDDGLR
ncbi:hypothetical protein ACLF3G_21995 [Falsiroseomonas sp. HC035]|uniref:hypothetical protein n=1 Tax=Falsiroseomonas sp. HC035 TaxID=3390999 RepID=UPI003D31341A